MKRFIVLFLLLSNFTIAQVPFKIHSAQLKLAPLRLLDPVNHGLEISFEINHKRKSTQFTGGYLFPWRVDGYENLNGLRLGVEEKFFFTQKSQNRKYFSIDFVISQLRSDDITYFNDTINNIRIADPFRVEKKFAILQMKIGKQFLLKRFIIDISTGAGAKYINTKHVGRVYPLNTPKDFNIIFSSKQEVNRITLNIPATIRIGFLL